MKTLNKPKQYQTVTANLNGDGSPSIVAWKNNREFDMIPLSDGKGGEIKRVAPITPLTDATPDLLIELRETVNYLKWAAQKAKGRVKADIVGGWEYQASKAEKLIRNIENA